MLNKFVILLLIIPKIIARCSYTNIRKDLINTGYNKIKNINNYTIFEDIDDLNIFNNIECNNGDFICQSDFYSVLNMHKYYSCNNGKWIIGKCGGISICHMNTNIEGCACW